MEVVSDPAGFIIAGSRTDGSESVPACSVESGSGFFFGFCFTALPACRYPQTDHRWVHRKEGSLGVGGTVFIGFRLVGGIVGCSTGSRVAVRASGLIRFPYFHRFAAGSRFRYSVANPWRGLGGVVSDPPLLPESVSLSVSGVSVDASAVSGVRILFRLIRAEHRRC